MVALTQPNYVKIRSQLSYAPSDLTFHIFVLQLLEKTRILQLLRSEWERYLLECLLDNYYISKAWTKVNRQECTLFLGRSPSSPQVFIIFHFFYFLTCLWIRAKDTTINTLNDRLTISGNHCHDLQNLIDEKDDLIVQLRNGLEWPGKCYCSKGWIDHST